MSRNRTTKRWKKIAEESLFATAVFEAGKKGFQEDAEAEALGSLKEIFSSLNSSKETIPYTTITQLNSLGTLDKVTVVPATIKELTERRHFKFSYVDQDEETIVKEVAYSTAIFQDLNGVDEIRSTFITSPKVLDAVRSQRDSTFLLTVALVKIPKKHREYVQQVLVLSATPLTSPLQLLLPTAIEIRQAEKFLEVAGDNPFKHIKTAVTNICNIHGLEKLPDLDTCIDFATLMAFSDGRTTIENTPGKIHLIVIGPPGVGKKLIAKAISTLSCIFNECHSSRVTVAGLSAATCSKDGTYTSKKGILPMSHLGSASIQDIQNISSDRLKQIYGILAMAMEDGEVLNSTAANTKFPARVSIVLDLNRQSQLYSGYDKTNISEDLSNMPKNLLTRADLILEIPHDTQRQLKVAGDIIKSDSVERKSSEISPRILQIAIALLQDKHASITIPSDVADYIQGHISRFQDDNKNNFERVPDISDHFIRTAISIKKIIHAHARAHNRDTATNEDVDAAFRFVSAKFDFLKTFSPTLNTGGLKFNNKERMRFLVARFEGKRFRVLAAQKAVKKHFKLKNLPDQRGIYRDLREIAVKRKKGFWAVRREA